MALRPDLTIGLPFRVEAFNQDIASNDRGNPQQ
jgi:hypothetical protein